MKCLECERELMRITTTHLQLCCGLTVAEYRAKYPGQPITDKPFERSLTREERRRRRAEYKLHWQQTNPAKYKQAMDKWVKANPDKINMRTKDFYAKHPAKAKAKARRINLRRNYGITVDQYEMIYNAQQGVCAIYGCEESKNKSSYLAIDHCHRTGVIRGLLCNRCNMAIGLMQDNAVTLYNAAKYLERFQDEASANVEAADAEGSQSL